jgi:ATP-dependent Lhr-like helicase
MIIEKKKLDSEMSLKKILHPLILKWFFKKFKTFSETQRYGISEVHSRNNILISAPTGGTKTLTSFLSILNELIDSSIKGILEDKVYCVYVSPLKALGNDIQKNLIEPLKEMEDLYGKPFNINVFVRTGDTPTSQRVKMLKHVPHILITTPETLAIVLNAIKFREKLKDVQWVILDEIHSIAENKRGSHLSLTLERLQRLNPGMCRVGLSATIAPLDEIAKFLVGYEGDELRPCKLVNVNFAKKKDFKVLSPVKNLIDTSYEKKQNTLWNWKKKIH